MTKQKTNLRLHLTDSAALISALLFYLGFGLHPLPVLTWFILLPLLVVSVRISAKRTAVLSLIAGLLGQIGMAIYFAGTLHMPLALLTMLVMYIAALMVGVVLLGRIFLKRYQPLIAVLAVASSWVTGEYLITLLAPHGAWWSLGYSQSTFLPVLQIVSATGVWGLSFLITAFPTAIAALTVPGATMRSKMKISTVLVVVAALIGILGIVRLHRTVSGPQLQMAAAVAAEPSEELQVTSDAGKKVLDDYQNQMERLAAQHVQTVVFPEKGLQVDQSQLQRITVPLTRASKQHNITAVIGVMVKTAPETYENRALIFTPNQGEASYVKHHLIPGLESDFDEGNSLVFVPGSSNTQGVIICKDLDFQAFVRSYRQSGASVLLAPAWDFNNDGWLHSRIAVVRGVENGMSIVRAGRDGQLTISDAQGRIRAEHSAHENTASSVIASVPAQTPPTFYAKSGDVLAYASLLVTTGSIIYLAAGHRKRATK